MKITTYEEKMAFYEKRIKALQNEYDNSSENMKSSDYKKRFLAEKAQLEMRYWKLCKMFYAWDNGKLDFEPTCSRSIYESQINAMETYLSILCMRYNIEFADDLESE